MVKAIQVLRIHLLELEKVSDLCKDFCSRYIACLKTKMNSETLLSGEPGSPYSPVQGQAQAFSPTKTQVSSGPLLLQVDVCDPEVMCSGLCADPQLHVRGHQSPGSDRGPGLHPAAGQCHRDRRQPQPDGGRWVRERPPPNRQAAAGS